MLSTGNGRRADTDKGSRRVGVEGCGMRALKPGRGNRMAGLPMRRQLEE